MNEEVNIKKVIEDENVNKVEKEEIKENKTEKEVINNLPDWSIEPPVEIKRGE